MSYATPADIQAEFKELTLSTDTQLTTVKVQGYLDQTDQIIDSYLGTVYTVPITGTKALVLVKKIEIDLVASRVAKILQIKTAAVLDGKGIRQEIIDQSAYKNAMAFLKDLQAGKASLLDADFISSGSGVESYTQKYGYEATFQRGVDQW